MGIWLITMYINRLVFLFLFLNKKCKINQKKYGSNQITKIKWAFSQLVENMVDSSLFTHFFIFGLTSTHVGGKKIEKTKFEI